MPLDWIEQQLSIKYPNGSLSGGAQAGLPKLATIDPLSGLGTHLPFGTRNGLRVGLATGGTAPP
jgi:hypothetical protein